MNQGYEMKVASSPGMPSKLRAVGVGALIAPIGGCLPTLWVLLHVQPSGLAFPVLVVVLGGLYLAWRTYRSHWCFKLLVGALLFAPAMFFLAQPDRYMILIDVSDSHFRRGVETDKLLAWATATLTLFLAGAASPLLVRSLGRHERVLHAASLTGLAGVAVLLASLVPRAVLFPAPAQYIESLPVVGVVPGPRTRPASSPDVDGTADFHELALVNLAVRRFCPLSDAQCARDDGGRCDNGCRVELTLYKEPFDRRDHIEPHLRKYLTDLREQHLVFDDDGVTPLLVRDDTAHAFVIVEGDIRRAIGCWSGPGGLTFQQVHLRDVADATGPPRGWIAASAAGVLIAGWLQLRRRRALRRLCDRLARARAGVLDTNGWIVFGDNAPPLHLGADMHLAPGPVLVVDPGGAPDKASGPYRGQDPLRHAEILPGDRSEILARERMAWMPRDAQVLAIVLLASAPLAAAAQFWLLR